MTEHLAQSFVSICRNDGMIALRSAFFFGALNTIKSISPCGNPLHEHPDQSRFLFSLSRTSYPFQTNILDIDY